MKKECRVVLVWWQTREIETLHESRSCIARVAVATDHNHLIVSANVDDDDDDDVIICNMMMS